jgi:hypothetical protein
MVAKCGDPILCVPKTATPNCGIRVKDMMPSPADGVLNVWRWKLRNLLGSAKEQGKIGSASTKVRFRRCRKIEFKTIVEQNDSIDRGSTSNIEVMDDRKFDIELYRPFVKDFFNIDAIRNTESDINIRPSIPAAIGTGPNVGTSCHSCIVFGKLDQALS